VGLGGRLAVDERLVAREVGQVAADRDPVGDGPGARHPVREIGVHDDGRRLRMVHDALDLGTGECRIQRDGLEPALLGRELPVENVDVVGECVGQNVPGSEALRPQGMDQLVGPAGELAEGQCHPAGARDDGREVRAFVGDEPEAEPLVPGVLHLE